MVSYGTIVPSALTKSPSSSSFMGIGNQGKSSPSTSSVTMERPSFVISSQLPPLIKISAGIPDTLNSLLIIV